VAIDSTYAAVSFHGTGPASAVTQALGLPPSSSHNGGERRDSRSERVWPSSHWNLHSGLPEDGDELEPHLRKLVDLLQPKQSEIDRLVAAGWELTWACFISEVDGQGGVTLSARLLRDLGAFPGELWLDIYASSGDEEG
jgi:hypothetical protein